MQESIDRLPFVLAAFLALLGAVAVGHLLVTSVRRRRRDFAVLKAIGFRRSQVVGAVSCQATTVTVVGLAIGALLGVVIGRAVWRAIAGSIGVLPEIDTPLVVLLLAGFGSVAVANLVALLPARAAARTQPAVVLRSE